MHIVPILWLIMRAWSLLGWVFNRVLCKLLIRYFDESVRGTNDETVSNTNTDADFKFFLFKPMVSKFFTEAFTK